MKNLINYIIKPIQMIVDDEKELVELLNRVNKTLIENDKDPLVKEYMKRREMEKFHRLENALLTYGLKEEFDFETKEFKTWYGGEIQIRFNENSETSSYNPQKREVEIKIDSFTTDDELVYLFLHERGHAENLPVPKSLWWLAALSYWPTGIGVFIHEAIADRYVSSKVGSDNYKKFKQTRYLNNLSRKS